MFVMAGICCGLAVLCAVLMAHAAWLHRRQRKAAERIRELRIEAVARGLLPLARAAGDDYRAPEVWDARLVRHKRHLALYAGGRDTRTGGRRTAAARARLVIGGRAAA